MTEPAKAVFLSYASRGAEAARRISESLCAAEVWFDQSELRGGAGRQRATSAIVRALATAVVAVFTDAAAVAAQTPAATQLRADIAAQPLVQALEVFARQTGWGVVYESAIVGDRQTSGAPAGLSPTEALTRILHGTGLQFTFLSSRSVQIIRADAATPTKPQRASTPDRSLLPEEVLVTATKREGLLATVPMSMSVLSSSAMEVSGIKGIADIAPRTPGIEYDFSSQFGSGTLTSIALRGIHSNTGQSTTALYIDDVPIHARHVDTVFGNPFPVTFDLARVEILRGPQGTLFGTGAEGGAIRFITNAPSTTKFGGLCQAEISATKHGNAGLEAGAAVGGPLVDGKLGARVSAWYRREGGFVDRVDPFTLDTVDKNANRKSIASLRVAFAFSPDHAVRVLPSYTYQSLEIHDSPSFYLYLSSPGAGVLRNGKLLRQPATDKFSLGALTVEADVGATTLTSATSYFDRTSSASVDQTNQAGLAFFGGYGNPLGPAYPSSYADAVANALGAQQSQFSQEIRLATRDSHAPSTWVAGIYYGRSHLNSTGDTYLVTAPQPPGLYSLESTVDTELAVFGDTTLSVSRRWRVTLGARLEQTRTDSSGSETGYANPVSVPFYRHAADTGASLAPRLAVSYEPDDGGLLFASASRGFRAGGLNIPKCGAPPRYAPDSVWSYEAGAKKSLFSGHLRLATSIFYAQWTDIQQRTSTTTSCFVDYTSNLGAAVSRGFDLTAEGLLGEHTYIAIDAGFLDAHYTTTINADGKTLVQQGTVVGALPAVPSPWSLVMRAEYRLPIRQATTIYAGAEEIVHSHNAGPFLESNPESPDFNTAVFSDPATSALHLHFGVTRGGLDVKVSVFNVLNSQPLLQHDSDGPGSTLQYAYTFRPRTLALTGTQRF
jgi:outer membrane receptor protein involved in Fe transport